VKRRVVMSGRWRKATGTATATHPRPDWLDPRAARPPRDIRKTPSSRLTILLRSDDTEANSPEVSSVDPNDAFQAMTCGGGMRCVAESDAIGHPRRVPAVAAR
jgi:hypothetical protein